MHNTSCPICRALCLTYPQRDFTLPDILEVVYSGLGQEVPTLESFDSTIFNCIFAMIEECQGLTTMQLKAFWAPMRAEVQRMRGIPE